MTTRQILARKASGELFELTGVLDRATDTYQYFEDGVGEWFKTERGYSRPLGGTADLLDAWGEGEPHPDEILQIPLAESARRHREVFGPGKADGGETRAAYFLRRLMYRTLKQSPARIRDLERKLEQDTPKNQSALKQALLERSQLRYIIGAADTVETSVEAPSALEQAVHTLYLHIGRYETLRMGTRERDAFADAVDKVSCRQDPEAFKPVTRWWNDDAPLAADPKNTGEDAARRAERGNAYQDAVPIMVRWLEHDRFEVLPSLERVRAAVNTSRLASGSFATDLEVLCYTDGVWTPLATVKAGARELPVQLASTESRGEATR